MSLGPGDELGDRYLPGPETPSGQQVRAATGLASFLRAPRRLTEFRGPFLVLVLLLAVVVAVTVLRTVT